MVDTVLPLLLLLRQNIRPQAFPLELVMNKVHKRKLLLYYGRVQRAADQQSQALKNACRTCRLDVRMHRYVETRFCQTNRGRVKICGGHGDQIRFMGKT